MSSLPKLIQDKLSSEKLAITEACKKAKLSFPSFKAVLEGRSNPNERTLKKYAVFLGISEDAVRTAAGTAERGKARAAKSSGKRRGRPPGAGARTVSAKRGGSGVEGAISQISTALKAASAIMHDALAVKVHGLEKRHRNVIESVVASLS